MRRVPLVPTLLVGLAVAAMIALGLWQLLDRLPHKEAFLAQLGRNPARAAIPFPPTPDDTLLFRHSTATCDRPGDAHLMGAGAAGFRMIVTCHDAHGAATIVQLGTTRDPKAVSTWPGGTVSGYISHAPDSRALIATLFDRTPQPLMLVADTPPPGLAANAAPDLGAVPNNHLAYAGQWFFFAAVAATIYALALRRRMRASL